MNLELTEEETYALSDLLGEYLFADGYDPETEPLFASIYNKLQEDIDPYGVMGLENENA